MGLNKQHLADTFSKARKTMSPFVFIEIVAEGVEEIITIPKRSFDAKEAFYARSYSDDLVHVMNSKVVIRGLSYGYSSELDNIAYDISE